MSLNYYIIDTETTGLRTNFHEVIQISAIRCSDNFQKTMNIKADFPQRAAKEALAVTNKTIGDLKNGIARQKATEQLIDFFEEDKKTPEHRCIVAHNAPFDRRFLHAMFESCGKKFPAELWMCTKEFSRKLAKKKGIVKPKLSLAASCEMAGVKIRKGAHNAVIDTLNTKDLWRILMDEKLGHVSLIKRVPHDF